MPPRILIIANAGPQVGGGHVMRSLTLATALAERGAFPTFLASPDVAAVLDAFAPGMAREPASSLEPAALPDAVTGIGFDAVIFDHYGLARAEQEAVAQGRPTLVIDDLADRPLAADIVLDAGPARTPADYALFAPDAELLLGPAYAPVRPEFAALRETALARRSEPVSRIMVALGLTDVGGITARVVDHLRQRGNIAAFDVALGASAPSLPTLQKLAARDARVVLHVDTQEMANLTAAADIAVGAAGSTTWERCVLGLPSILLVLAPNQEMAARAMAERHAALVLDPQSPDFDQLFDRTLIRLMADRDLRSALSAASAAVCDGQGANRVAEALLRLIGQRANA